ncbi:MAG TPA: phosphate ABC transporter substrate-binding protein PstS [Thermoplasmata archaeon]|nr:phosphate ABC transporter substrate-binding protein PstS [Thermoplasmata archaeon]
MSSTSGSATTPPTPSDQIVRKGKSRTGLYAVIAVVVVIVIILAAGYAAGWFKGSSSGATASCTLPGSQTLDGAGSTLVAPLMLTWAQAYTASTVNYDPVGSGAGISDITEKTVDFGASDAPLNPSQRAGIPSPGVVTIPESAGAAVPIYNLPGVSGHLKFTGQILAAIYLGDITNWNNTALQGVNPGVVLPHATIVVVHRSDGSGTTFVWSSFLSAANATWNKTLSHSTTINWPVGVGAHGNSGVTSTVQTTTDSIGYVDINYALTNGVAFGAVQNPAGNFIVANLTNIASAIKDSNVVFPSPTGDWYNVTVENAKGTNDYPIATFTYIFVYTDLGKAYSTYTLGKAENLVDFLSWIVGPTGQSYAPPLYYVTLSSAAVTYATNTINSLTYNGQTIPVCVPTG